MADDDPHTVTERANLSAHCRYAKIIERSCDLWPVSTSGSNTGTAALLAALVGRNARHSGRTEYLSAAQNLPFVHLTTSVARTGQAAVYRMRAHGLPKQIRSRPSGADATGLHRSAELTAEPVEPASSGPNVCAFAIEKVVAGVRASALLVLG